MDNFPARRPAPGAQLTERSSPKLLKNSRKLPKKFPDPEAGITCSSGCAAGPAVKLRNSRKKVKVSAIFVPEPQVYAPGARREFPCNLRNKIRRKQGKFFAFHLDLPGSRCIYIPGRDTNEYPEDIERTEMLDFLLGILLPLKLLLLGYAAWQLLGWLL